MSETLLVRAAGGGWEELQPQTSMPEGGILEVFGEDVGPVFGTSVPVVVAAARPQLATGEPDAICVDTDGGIWVLQLDLDGGGELTLPQLLAFGGSLNGMGWSTFEQLCDRRGTDTLDAFVAARAPSGFQRDAFQVNVTEALATGRIHLVSVVRDAAPTLVQSMRFLNASGAMGSVFEASAFASSNVAAIRATAIEVGAGSALRAHEAIPPAAAPAAAPASGGTTASATGPAAAPPSRGKRSEADTFVKSTTTRTDASTGALMQQLVSSCGDAFDASSFVGTGAAQELHATMAGPDGDELVVLAASTDGSVVLSFEALSGLDPDWTVRAELCQGMERLLGADLGDVRKISQLNLSIAEHLMDATLMEALVELLTDTTRTLRESQPAMAA